jgi:hypothetical protein
MLGLAYAAFALWLGFRDSDTQDAQLIWLSNMYLRHAQAVLPGSLFLGTLAEISLSLHRK